MKKQINAKCLVWTTLLLVHVLGQGPPNKIKQLFSFRGCSCPCPCEVAQDLTFQFESLRDGENNKYSVWRSPNSIAIKHSIANFQFESLRDGDRFFFTHRSNAANSVRWFPLTIPPISKCTPANIEVYSYFVNAFVCCIYRFIWPLFATKHTLIHQYQSFTTKTNVKRYHDKYIMSITKLSSRSIWLGALAQWQRRMCCKEVWK